MRNDFTLTFIFPKALFCIAKMIGFLSSKNAFRRKLLAQMVLCLKNFLVEPKDELSQ